MEFNSFLLFPNAPSQDPKAPTHSAMAGEQGGKLVNVGAGWKKQGKEKVFVAVKLNEGLKIVGEPVEWKKKDEVKSDDVNLDEIPF